MTYTLADFQKLAKSDLEQAVITTWREKSPVMDLIPWVQKSALSVEFRRSKPLSEMTWRNFDDTFTEIKADTESVTERVHFLGNKIDIPKALKMADTIVDQSTYQKVALAESLAKTFNFGFIKGDPSDAKSLVGLHYRLKTVEDAGQSLAGSSLDISPDTATATWISQFFDKLEELRSLCEGGDCDAFIMNRTAKMRLESAMRNSGLKSTTEDKTGKRYPSYGEGGPRIIDIGYKNDDSTMVIGNVENADGNTLTGGACTTIYAVKFGEPHVSGFYEYPINTVDNVLLEDQINYRTVVEWSPGIYHVNPRSFARLHGLVAA
jgi:hypothetical protein